MKENRCLDQTKSRLNVAERPQTQTLLANLYQCIPELIQTSCFEILLSIFNAFIENGVGYLLWKLFWYTRVSMFDNYSTVTYVLKLNVYVQIRCLANILPNKVQQLTDLEVEHKTNECLVERDIVENPESLIVAAKGERDEMEYLISDYQVDLDDNFQLMIFCLHSG